MQRRRSQPLIAHLPRPLAHPILIHPLQPQHRRDPYRLSEAQESPLMVALTHLKHREETERLYHLDRERSDASARRTQTGCDRELDFLACEAVPDGRVGADGGIVVVWC